MAGSGVGRVSLVRRRGWVAAVVALLVGGLALINSTTPVSATTVSVATEAEYRAALTNLSTDGAGPHVINLTADITIAGPTDPTYSNATQLLTINGNGHTLDGGNNGRILAANIATGLLTINDLTATGGDNPPGGAIFAGGAVSVNNSTFSGNTSGTVTSTGGAIRASGAVTVNNSTFSANTSGRGGAIFTLGAVTVTNSTFTGNTATVPPNSSGGAIFTVAAVTVTSSTFSSNTAPVGASIQAPSLTRFGSVVADPLGGGANCSIGASPVSGGYNFSDDASCAFTGTGDTENGADPQLLALGDFGGPTPTRPPAVSSPLVDAIPVAACSPTVTTDQRGLPRPSDGNDDGIDGCDIGAVELQATPPPEPPVPPAPPAPPAPPVRPAGPVAARPSFTG